jgi:hypothetical protein
MRFDEPGVNSPLIAPPNGVILVPFLAERRAEGFALCRAGFRVEGTPLASSVFALFQAFGAGALF